MNSFCLFCKSGSEQAVARSINSIQKEFFAIAPRRVVQEKRKKTWEQRDLALLPGYVFLYSEETLPNHSPATKPAAVYKVLEYDDGIRALQHEDHDYAMWVYRNQGQITSSRVLCDGQNIQVLDGPLLDCQGKIVRLDRHKRRAMVEFDFDGQKRVVSLGAEFIAAISTENA